MKFSKGKSEKIIKSADELMNLYAVNGKRKTLNKLNEKKSKNNALDTNEETVSKQPFTVYKNGEKFKSGETNSDGIIEYDGLIPAKYQILVKSSDKE